MLKPRWGGRKNRNIRNPGRTSPRLVPRFLSQFGYESLVPCLPYRGIIDRELLTSILGSGSEFQAIGRREQSNQLREVILSHRLPDLRVNGDLLGSPGTERWPEFGDESIADLGR